MEAKLNTLPFDYEVAIKDVSKVFDSHGNPVVELHYFASSDRTPVVAAIKDSKGVVHVRLFNKDGKSCTGGTDLVICESLQQIDWVGLPENTLIELPDGRVRHLLCAQGDQVFYHSNGRSSLTIDGILPSIGTTTQATIIDDPRWNVHFGGKCPLPLGIQVEVVKRSGDKIVVSDVRDVNWSHGTILQSDRDIIGYRVMGVSNGYSPSFN